MRRSELRHPDANQDQNLPAEAASGPPEMNRRVTLNLTPNAASTQARRQYSLAVQSEFLGCF